MYLPDGNPEVTGEVPPTEIQGKVASGVSLANRVSDTLTSKVISVPESRISSQKKASHLSPSIPVSQTWEAMVPEDTYDGPLAAAFKTALIIASRSVPLQVAVGFSVPAVAGNPVHYHGFMAAVPQTGSLW